MFQICNFPFPSDVDGNGHADVLQSEEVGFRQKFLALLEELIQVALRLCQPVHIQAVGDLVRIVQVSPPKLENGSEQLCTDLELKFDHLRILSY